MCVCLSVCVGVGAHFYVKERAVATVELKQERSTLRSHTESIRQRSEHVLSLWFLSLTLTLWFLSVVWHPIIPCLSPSPLLYMLHRFIFPSFSISSFPSSRILLFYFSFLHPSCLSSCNPLSHLFVWGLRHLSPLVWPTADPVLPPPSRSHWD